MTTFEVQIEMSAMVAVRVDAEDEDAASKLAREQVENDMVVEILNPEFGDTFGVTEVLEDENSKAAC